ncbi:MAG: hypothetical protein JXJ20_02395 [Anaerolineae bacterium]|nr:hypothetical protein [Anaerolineae bacterium]
MSEQRQALQRVLGFQPEDLDANRSGQLGPRQRAKIETTKKQYLIGGGFFGIVLLIFFVFLVRDGFTGWPIFGMCLGTMLLLLVGAVWLQITVLNADLAVGSVECVTGPVERTIRRTRTRRAGSSHSTRTTRHYYVRVGEKSFKVLPQVYNAFEDGRAYEVFFLPKSNAIVGADMLDQAPAPPEG